MRSPKEMFEGILHFAKNDERVRAVILNGSRANPNAPSDIFQDFDIVYVVRDIASFTKNHQWIDVFGERRMLQMPETMRHPANNGYFSYLILFSDGNRMDLSLYPEDLLQDLDKRESASILLLDKDRKILPYPPASDESYLAKKPSKNEYESCCNNFWWCTQNVAKGIKRKELPYAIYMLEIILREELQFVLDWYIGVKTNHTVSSGKAGKYVKKYLSQSQYELYEKTYNGSSEEKLWTALFSMCHLFREVAAEISSFYQYEYPKEYDENMMVFLLKMKELPPGATEIF